MPKKVLNETDGDLEKAMDLLKEEEFLKQLRNQTELQQKV